jgi:citrate synthase
MFTSQAWRGKTGKSAVSQEVKEVDPQFVTLTMPDGKSVQLPILEGTAGPNMIDIRTLYQKTGMFTYDPGFTCTGSCESGITFIDGGK